MKGAAASAAAPMAAAAFLLLAALAGETRAAKVLVFPSQGHSAESRGRRRSFFSGDSTDTASTPVVKPTDAGCVDLHGCAEARSRQDPSSPAGSFADSDTGYGGSGGDSLVQHRKYRRTGRSRSPPSIASPTKSSSSVSSSALFGSEPKSPEVRGAALRQSQAEGQAWPELLDVIRGAFGEEAAQRLEENREVLAQLEACPLLHFDGAAPSTPADFLERYLRSLGLPRLVDAIPEDYVEDEVREEAIEEDFERRADEDLLADVSECAYTASLVAMYIADPSDEATQASLASLERLYLEEECRSLLPSPAASTLEAAQRWDSVVFGFRVQDRHACAHKAALAGLADLTARGDSGEELHKLDETAVERAKAMLFAALQPQRSDPDDGEVVEVPELEEWWHDLGLSYEDLDALEESPKHKISSSDPRRSFWKFVQRMKPCRELLAQAKAPEVAQALGQRCAEEARLRAAAAAAASVGSAGADEGGFEELGSTDLVSQDVPMQAAAIAPTAATSESLLEASAIGDPRRADIDWGALASRGTHPADRAAGASAGAGARGGSCPVFELGMGSDPWLALDEYLLRLTPRREDADRVEMAPRVRCASDAYATAVAMVERQALQSAGVQKAQLQSLRHFHPDLFPALRDGASDERMSRANGLLRQRACPQLELGSDIANGLDEYLVSLDRIGPLASLDEYPAWQRRCAALAFEAAKEAAEQASPHDQVEMRVAISDVRRFHPLLFPEFAELLPAEPTPRRLRTRGAADAEEPGPARSEQEMYDEIRDKRLLYEV